MTQSLPPVLGGVAPYLGVSNAGKAADFYVKALAASEILRMPPDEKGRYMHIHLVVNGPHRQADSADPWGKRGVEAGAAPLMPVIDMFWGDRYGQFRDPFGVRW